MGRAIATAIGSIDFAGIAWDFGDLALKILGAIAEAIQGAFAQSPVETAIITALGFIKLSTLTTKTFENAATKILEVMGTSLEKDETALTVLGGKIKGAIGTAVEKIGEFTTEKFIPIAKNILSKIGSGMTSAGEAIVDLGGKIKGAIELSIGKIKDFGANYMKPLAGKIMTKIATAVGAETATVGGIANADWKWHYNSIFASAGTYDRQFVRTGICRSCGNSGYDSNNACSSSGSRWNRCSGWKSNR